MPLSLGNAPLLKIVVYLYIGYEPNTIAVFTKIDLPFHSHRPPSRFNN